MVNMVEMRYEGYGPGGVAILLNVYRIIKIALFLK